MLAWQCLLHCFGCGYEVASGLSGPDMMAGSDLGQEYSITDAIPADAGLTPDTDFVEESHDCLCDPAILGDRVFIEAGRFKSSCGDEDCSFLREEERLLDDYMIDRTEVSLAEYQACVADGACSARKDCSLQDTSDRSFPATCVSRVQGMDFCTWRVGRLASGDELERVVRGSRGRLYPWSDDWWVRGRVPANIGPSSAGVALTVVSGSAGASLESCVYNLVGNVAEWVLELRETPFRANMPTVFGGSFLS